MEKTKTSVEDFELGIPVVGQPLLGTQPPTTINHLVNCPECKAENDPNSLYCYACGEKMSNTKTCLECKRENDASKEFCVGCGKKFKTKA